MTGLEITATRARGNFDRRGFTLIEIMIVIAIMAVVMSISIPTFYRSMQRDAIRQATQQVLDACKEARTQAILSGRPCDLIIRPQDRTLVPQLAVGADPDTALTQAQPIGQSGGGAGAKATGTNGPDGKASQGMLPDGVVIMFVGVNFVPDLQTTEVVPVRFYPNGTADEFAMLIRSDQNEWRKFTMDVATGMVNWEVVK